MRIIVDTNILLRFLVKDDDRQLDAVYRIFKECEEIIIPTHVFCELNWVLSKSYGFKNAEILGKFEDLVNSRKVTICEDEVEAGLLMMRSGGDFADGVNAYKGQKMSNGIAVFVSFDKKAVRLLSQQGVPTIVPK